MNYALTFVPESLGNFYTIALPWSKSVRNRQLVIEFLRLYHETSSPDDSPGALHDNLQLTCDDVFQLQKPLETLLFSSLSSKTYSFNVQGAGTAMRFLSAVCALLPRQFHLSGDARMCERPIAPLVDALRTLGCEIEYEGYPPLFIKGGGLTCSVPIELPASTSSQFISALLLIAPYIKGGLELHLLGTVVSKPYIALTLNLMERCGAKVETDFKAQHPMIKVYPEAYYSVRSNSECKDCDLPERDWSSASYFLALAFLLHKKWNKTSMVFLFPQLRGDSMQGDRAQIELFESLGMTIEYSEEGLRFSSKDISPAPIEDVSPEDENPIVRPVFTRSFKTMPDLLPTFVVMFLMMDRPFCFTGVRNLRFKECNRLEALRVECKKMGYVLEEKEDEISWQGKRCESEEEPCFDTYNDHRMAMSLALFSLERSCTISHAEVVKKSCPNFWTNFKQFVSLKEV